MMYESPLAYVLGLEGLALLRSFTGEFDREFVDARIAEIRRLLADESLASAAVDVARVNTVEGYGIWSHTYDGPNSAFDVDEPVIEEIVDGLPAGVALDAACGTGRLSGLLAERGHRIIGVDSSPDMLARARERVPEGDFRLGELERLPVADEAVDLVVCALALTHVPDLRPVMAEFARVLRPGGHLVISDIHAEWVARGAIPPVRLPDGRPGRLASHRHATGDYLRAALAVGLEVRRCEEPGRSAGEAPEAQDPSRAREPSGSREPAPSQERSGPQDQSGSPEPSRAEGRYGPETQSGAQVPSPSPATSDAATPQLGPWEVWPWCLADLVPEAARAANAGVPVEVIWHFQRAGA